MEWIVHKVNALKLVRSCFERTGVAHYLFCNNQEKCFHIQEPGVSFQQTGLALYHANNLHLRRFIEELFEAIRKVNILLLL